MRGSERGCKRISRTGAEALDRNDLLLTGFGPFDIFRSNPSGELSDTLADEFDCRSEILPVIFGQARSRMKAILQDFLPHTVLSFGLNGGISHIALEQIAVNMRYSEIPDNEGRTHEMSPIVEGGPLAYRSNIPLDRILLKLREAGIPSRMSFSAGTYICNEVFYTLLEYCRETGAKGSFIHVPMASSMISGNPRLVSGPHMHMGSILEAGRISIRECLR